MAPGQCFMCLKDLQEEPEHRLQCSSCKHSLHYSCGLGYADPVKAFRTSTGKDQYTCPICIVASYNYLHMALKRHEELMSEQIHNVSGEVDDASSSASAHSRHSSQDVVEAEGEVAPGELANTAQREDTRRADTRLEDTRDNAAGNRSHSHDSTPIPDYRPVVSADERKRESRCTAMLSGLKHIPPTVDTLIIVDSNGRGIKSEDIDDSGAYVCFRQIGGLCVAATTAALNSFSAKANRTFPKIKHLSFGLGTNDHLHRRQHPGRKVDYLTELDTAARKVFPMAKISFMVPFSAIKRLGVQFNKDLSAAIKECAIGWRVLITPSMQGKLVAPKELHLDNQGKKAYIDWLRKVFSPKQLSPSEEPLRSVDPQPRAPRAVRSDNFRVQNQLPSTITSTPSNQVTTTEGMSGSEFQASYNSVLKDQVIEFLLGKMANRSQQTRDPPWRY